MMILRLILKMIPYGFWMTARLAAVLLLTTVGSLAYAEEQGAELDLDGPEMGGARKMPATHWQPSVIPMSGGSISTVLSDAAA